MSFSLKILRASQLTNFTGALTYKTDSNTRPGKCTNFDEEFYANAERHHARYCFHVPGILFGSNVSSADYLDLKTGADLEKQKHSS